MRIVVAYNQFAEKSTAQKIVDVLRKLAVEVVDSRFDESIVLVHNLERVPTYSATLTFVTSIEKVYDFVNAQTKRLVADASSTIAAKHLYEDELVIVTVEVVRGNHIAVLGKVKKPKYKQ